MKSKIVILSMFFMFCGVLIATTKLTNNSVDAKKNSGALVGFDVDASLFVGDEFMDVDPEEEDQLFSLVCDSFHNDYRIVRFGYNKIRIWNFYPAQLVSLSFLKVIRI